MSRKNLITILVIAIIALIIGLMNTVFIKAEDMGTWKNYLGLLFMLIAIVHFILFAFLIRKKRKRLKEQ